MISCSNLKGDKLATHKVNLEALIAREDFESSSDSSAQLGTEPLFKVEELQKGKLYFSVLRKPDFQRQTNNWTPEMIVDFVQNFLDGNLIPSIIIWHSKQSGKVFIVDGAHRVSALIAWVNDDYGDGPISRSLLGQITPVEERFHKATKALMAERVGDYARLVHVALNSDGADPEMVRRGRAIATLRPPIQKVEGTATIAEESFLKINGNPATIDPTELDLIRARRKPNALAARALMVRGVGRKDLEKFGSTREKEIISAAQRAYDVIFGPIQLQELTSQSPDIPRAGQPYSKESFQMGLDMVNIFNGVTPAMWQAPKGKSSNKNTVVPLSDDADGSVTLAFLERVEQAGNLISDNDGGSLGFDPAVYAYGDTGKFHSAAYLASLVFAQELKEQNRLRPFTTVRNSFEEFLVRHKGFINDLLGSKGGRTRPLESILTMHRIILSSLLSDIADDSKIIAILKADQKLIGLEENKNDSTGPEDSTESKGKKRFSKTAQAVAIVREILAHRPRCTICGSRVPPHSRSKDHVIRAADGGSGHSDNLAFTHPYCNQGHKEQSHSPML
jgi:hypothetical protein